MARMGNRSSCRIWWGDLVERDQLEDPGVEGRITIEEMGWRDMDCASR